MTGIKFQSLKKSRFCLPFENLAAWHEILGWSHIRDTSSCRHFIVQFFSLKSSVICVQMLFQFSFRLDKEDRMVLIHHGATDESFLTAFFKLNLAILPSGG